MDARSVHDIAVDMADLFATFEANLWISVDSPRSFHHRSSLHRRQIDAGRRQLSFVRLKAYLLLSFYTPPRQACTAARNFSCGSSSQISTLVDNHKLVRCL